MNLLSSLTRVAPVKGKEPRDVVSKRRRVVAGTSVVGASLLGASLSTQPGSKKFYVSTGVVACVWSLGALASGPLHRGWITRTDSELERPVLTPLATGVGAFAAFYAAALVARRIPVLDDAISGVLTFAEEGDDKLVLATTLANGVGEELFFRGALYAALPSQPVLASTAIYTLSTTATRNPALVLAAAVMGSLFAVQRRGSGGVQAPIITHLTWSTLMVKFLPPLFRRPQPQETP